MFDAQTQGSRYKRGGARRRVLGIVAVVVLHAAVIYALAKGMETRVISLVHKPLMATIFEDIKPPPPTTPLPVPKPEPQKPAWIPPPAKHVQPPQPKAITVVTAAPTPPPVVAPAEGTPTIRPAPILAPAVIDPSHSCSPPDYPPSAKRLGQTGTVVVKFLIEEDGSIADSQIETTSGYPRLDEAARQALSLCHFKAGTVDGRPERSWAQIKYVWKLN